MLRCPVCQSEKDERYFIETYVSPFNNQEYKLYHCETCDLQWWEPLKIIPEFYEMEGLEGYKNFHTGQREEIEYWHKPFFKYFPLKSGRLLDVGCGDGVFLKEAQKAGFEVWGIDFDSKSIKVCQEKWGLKNTFAMSPQEFAEFCQKEGLKFDVITFFEVLEHQDKPVEFLEAIKSMLKPGGYIAGSVPNRESFETLLLRRCDYWDYPPHHFLRFSERAINLLFDFIGCRDSYIKPMRWKYADMASSLQSIVMGNRYNKIFKKILTSQEFIDEKIYKELPIYRKVIFKILKGFRDFVFYLPVFIITVSLKGGRTLYFHCRFSCN